MAHVEFNGTKSVKKLNILKIYGYIINLEALLILKWYCNKNLENRIDIYILTSVYFGSLVPLHWNKATLEGRLIITKRPAVF